MDSDDGSHLQAFGSRSAMPPPPLASFGPLADAGAAAHGSHHHPHHHHQHHHLCAASSSDHPQLLSMPYDYSNGASVVTGLMPEEAPQTQRFSMTGSPAYGDHHHRRRHPQSLLPEPVAGDEADAGRSAANSSDLAPDGGVMAEDLAAGDGGDEASHRAKILSHPLFPRLVQVYVNCRKIGAPAEVVAVLEEAGDLRHIHSFRSKQAPVIAVGDDPELDDFMGAYADKLQVHHDELTESLEEARSFLKRMETQLQALSGGGGGAAGGGRAGAAETAGRTTGNGRPVLSGNGMEASTAGCQGMKAGGAPGGATTTTDTGGDSSEEEDEDGSCCEADYNNNNNSNNSSSHLDQAAPQSSSSPHAGGGGGLMIDPVAEESQLKKQLLRKYSGIMICSLKREFLKRKKKGKLPKEARQKLLEWWSQHYKWPYPSENEKAALAEVTGLNQKQINNWFINQRKRHWKPSEDLQYAMQLDAAAAAATITAHHHHSHQSHNHHQNHHTPAPELDHTAINTAAGNNGSNHRRYDNNKNSSNNSNTNNNNANHQIISFEFGPSSSSGSPVPPATTIHNQNQTHNPPPAAGFYNMLSFAPPPNNHHHHLLH